MLPLQQNRKNTETSAKPIRIRDILWLKNLQLSQKHLSKEHCELFLSSKPSDFLYHTSDFSTTYKGQSKENEKITTSWAPFHPS